MGTSSRQRLVPFVARGLLGRKAYVRRYYAYYLLMRVAPERVNHFLWRHWPAFRKWWGAW